MTAPTQKLALSDIEGDAASINRAIKYDAANSIIQERSDIVGLKFANTLGEGSNANASNLF